MLALFCQLSDPVDRLALVAAALEGFSHTVVPQLVRPSAAVEVPQVAARELTGGSLWATIVAAVVSIVAVSLYSVRWFIAQKYEHEQVTRLIEKAAPNASMDDLTATIMAVKSPRIRGRWVKWSWREGRGAQRPQNQDFEKVADETVPEASADSPLAAARTEPERRSWVRP